MPESQPDQASLIKSGTPKLLLVAAKILVSAVLIYLIVRDTDLNRVFEVFAQGKLLYYIAAIFFLIVEIPLAAFRWNYVSKRIGIEMAANEAFKLTYIGQFFSQILPSSFGGDALKIWYIRNKAGVGNAIISIFLDRAIGFLAIALVFLMTLPSLLNRMDAATVILPLAVIALIGLLAVVMLVTARGLLERLLGWLPLSHYLMKFVDGFRLAVLGPHFPQAFALSVCIHLLTILAVLMLAAGMGLSLDWLTGFMLMPTVVLAAALPFSYAGWGLREGVMIFVLGMAGVPQAEAFALSIALGLSIFVAALPGSIAWFWR